MSDYPATSLALNKGKYYVLLTIPQELREHFNGRKQLKKSTGTSDLGDARRRQHNISTELYAKLDACQPDPRDTISNLLGWIGDADEVQRLEDSGDLEGIIMAHKFAEDPHDADKDKDVSNIDLVHEGGARALEAYLRWKAQGGEQSADGAVTFSEAAKRYLETKPYGPAKTMRDCELSLEQFEAYAGDILLEAVTPVSIHAYAEEIGQTKSRETVAKKIGYVKRMFDHAVRKGWVGSNVFVSIKLDKNIGRARVSYVPLAQDELGRLFEKDMEPHLRQALAILTATGMRLDEASLLSWEDVKKDDKQNVMYFDLTEAIVKNQGSRRKVPVHSALDWIETGKTGQMFPEFTRDKDGKAQASASKALMPLIRNVTDQRNKVVHSLRGNFKDMLRDAGVSKEINDFITGHGSGDVAGQYGEGPSLSVRKEAVERLRFPFAYKAGPNTD